MRQRIRACCVGLVAALALAAGDAGAHAELIASTPPDGAVLATPPQELLLRFNEPVIPVVMRVFAASGTPLVVPRAPGGAAEEVRVVLPPLAAGSYVFSYRVTSLDSHPVGGSIAFAIGTEALPQRALAPSESAPPDTMRWANRVLHYVGLLCSAGAALYVLAVAPFPGQTIALLAAALITLLSAIAGVGLQGASLLGSAGLLDPDAWSAGWHSTRGTSAVAAAAGATAVAVAISLRPGRACTALLAIGATCEIGSLLLTGHVAAPPFRALAVPAHAAHASAAAFWAGSLVALALTLRATQADGAIAAVRRFSRLAAIAVPMLIAGAIVLAVIRLSTPSDLLATPYGRLVLAKSAVLAALLALAALNRWRLTPAWERGDARAPVRLRRSIWAEIVLVVCVAAVTAALTDKPFPRMSAALTRTLHAGGRTAELTIVPARVGANTLTIAFRRPDHAAFDPDEVTVALANERAGLEPLARRPNRIAPGSYRVDADIAFAGTWRLQIHVRVGDFEQVTFDTDVPIP